jgi:hypothetical protein
MASMVSYSLILGKYIKPLGIYRPKETTSS